jgi:hypothetical protein
MAQQTAVWWLAEQLFKDATPTLRQRALIEEAKEMEKEHLERFFECGRNFQLTGEGTFKQVYDEIFGTVDYYQQNKANCGK